MVVVWAGSMAGTVVCFSICSLRRWPNQQEPSGFVNIEYHWHFNHRARCFDAATLDFCAGIGGTYQWWPVCLAASTLAAHGAGAISGAVGVG